LLDRTGNFFRFLSDNVWLYPHMGKSYIKVLLIMKHLTIHLNWKSLRRNWRAVNHTDIVVR